MTLLKVVQNIKCKLGEGLLWDDKNCVLLMSDIENNKLIEIDINDFSFCACDMPEPISWVLLTECEGIYTVGLKSGIALVDTNSLFNLRWLNRDFPNNPQCRLNDACTDSTGRIWYGSMNYHNERSMDGKLASFTAGHRLKVHDEGFTVTNGPLISPDSKYLYFSDTLNGIVYRYSFSLTSGEVANRRTFLTFKEDQGLPDGMCFDIEGNLWIAMWGAAKVIKFSTAGELLCEFGISAPNVTNVCFCGIGLDRLFVSTASIGMSKATAKKHPQSGRLFEIMNHGTRGFTSCPVKLS